MTGRHEGEADDLGAILAVLVGLPALLALVIYYFVAGGRFTNLDYVIAAAAIAFVWMVKFVVQWRVDRRFPPLLALCGLAWAIAAADVLAPSWHWVRWAGYVVAGMLLVLLLRDSVQSWRRRQLKRGLDPWHLTDTRS